MVPIYHLFVPCEYQALGSSVIGEFKVFPNVFSGLLKYFFLSLLDVGDRGNKIDQFLNIGDRLSQSTKHHFLFLELKKNNPKYFIFLVAISNVFFS